MTEVEKVSIGGYAFTLEVKAYAIVKQYLDELNEHYAPLEGGAEIMEGIEERMAELLYEKCADDGVASVEEVNEIIAILGKPSAIEAGDDPEPKRAEAPGAKPTGGKKRLYRDPTGKILGGVCSGLAAYFKVDVVIVRIIFIALFILGISVSVHIHNGIWNVNGFNGVVALVYIALWIAMPEAKTVKQRWEMGVTNPPAGGQPAGSGLGRVLRIVIGCILLLIGVSGMTSGIGALFGHQLFGWDYVFDWEVLRDGWNDFTQEVPEVVSLISSGFFKVTALLVFFLPFIGMTYAGIMMIFDFKSPSWRPGLVIFLVWVVSLVVLAIISIMGFAGHVF